MKFLVCVLALFMAVSACGDDGDDDVPPDAAVPPDAPVPPDAGPPDADPANPLRLASTGLYSDFENETLADGVVEFAPEHVLWSDVATKRRWILIPDGAQIDTSNMNFWHWPQGTKLWKEFTRDDVRVETRYLYKYGPTSEDWFMMAYAWNEEQTEALAARSGVQDALSTNHDIPSQSVCAKCHGRVEDVALGASAIQLDHDGPGLTLADLIADDRLTDPPAGALDIPGTAVEQAALGYFHVNCGTCHNDYSDVQDKVDMRLMLTVETLGAVTTTPVYTTAVGVEPNRSTEGATYLIEAGNSAASAVHIRMSVRGPISMPPVGSEDVDTVGLAAVDAWIDSL